MHLKILGSAAGGAFPQWNCSCPNCHALREGTFSGKPRSQTQVAVSADGRAWFLLGASPDLRQQIEVTPELHPREGLRQSPISGVVLANADLDHVLGLLLLRELQPLQVYSTASVRRILREDNSIFAMLQRIPNQVAWTDFRGGEAFPLFPPTNLPENNAPISCRPWPLREHYPAYVSAERRSHLASEEASMGLILTLRSGARLAHFPAVPELNESLLHELETCDLLLFDGTFWSDDELIRIQGSGQTAKQMGHIPVQDTLGMLAGLRRPRKIFLHINNTNPMLNQASAEHRRVREAGWEIAEDGWQFTL